jgi:hypothetical protein
MDPFFRKLVSQCVSSPQGRARASSGFSVYGVMAPFTFNFSTEQENADNKTHCARGCASNHVGHVSDLSPSSVSLTLIFVADILGTAFSLIMPCTLFTIVPSGKTSSPSTLTTVFYDQNGCLKGTVRSNSGNKSEGVQ